MKIADKDEFEKQNAFGTGTPNTAYAKYFIGESYLNPLTKPEDGLHLLNVTFEPGCRNNWHIHHAAKGGGQLLIGTFTTQRAAAVSSSSAQQVRVGIRKRAKSL